MKNLERSLCSDCVYLTSCSLTTNKNFIWSCSEYEHNTTQEQKSQSQTTEFSFAYSKKEIELI